MAGAGYKLFNTGDVLTAAQVNTYLMEQTVMVFADAAARTTALSGVVSEGMISYLKDTNAVEVYDGSNWVSSDDPNAIQNTIVDAKGDLITATASDVPARLAVGANGTILEADSAASTGLKWGGGWTTWTPTVTGLTIGNGTQIARYQKVANTINFQYRVLFGSTTAITGDFRFTAPENHDGNFYGNLYAGAWDASPGTFYMMAPFTFSSADVYVRSILTNGTYASTEALSATAPFTWAVNDILTCSGSYEV